MKHSSSHITAPGGARRAVFTLIAWVSVLIGSFPAAADSLVIDADKQFAFADSLLAEGTYSSAAEEFRRFLFFFPEDPRNQVAHLKIGFARFRLHDYAAALQALSFLEQSEEVTEPVIEAFLLAARCRMRRGDPAGAVRGLENLHFIAEDETTRALATAEIGWILAETGKIDDARRRFESIDPARQDTFRVPQTTAGLRRLETLPKKSPLGAGIMSAVIPGSGYLYVNRKQDALISFTLCALFATAAVESFNEDLNALGGILSFTALGFYSGNIYGSAAAAEKHNRRRRQNFLENLKQSISAGLSPQKGGVMVGIQFQFH